MKKERFIFADVIRTIAIIFVIMIHTTSSYMYDVVLGTDVLSFNLVLILNSIFSIAVALFFMISGCFLIRKDSDLDRNHFKRVVKRIVQLLFWTICYLLFCKYVLDWNIDLNYSLKAMFFNVQVSHLWFMYPLIALYCVSFYTIFVFLEDRLKNMPNFLKKIITSIGQNSGGIYFLHMLILYIIGNLYIGSIGFTSNEGNILFMILGAFLYFIVSYLVILILKKIPIIKYFVE